MDNKPIIGITLGDYNGIGPEVVLKALSNKKILQMCTPVIYGSHKVLLKYRKLLELEEWTVYPLKQGEPVGHKRTNIVNCWDENVEILPGKITPEAGNAAYTALKAAVDDLKNGRLDALVTAPINKANIQNTNFQFPGHTEYLTEAFGMKESLMLMVSENLKIGVVTGHIPLQKVSEAITKEKLNAKIDLLLQTMNNDFGIIKPRIAVLGLNPHAGEAGLLGNEEIEIIQPVVKNFRQKGHLIFGPYPADGFFGTGNYKKYDAVLAMYHDQGLIPFKTLAFENGVNYTAGLPIIRTSPDHGTAYDIAGKNMADENSMREAIFLAYDIARLRKEAKLVRI